jgi:hypothetical protein
MVSVSVFFWSLLENKCQGFRASGGFDTGVMIADILFVLAAYFMTLPFSRIKG